MSPTHGSGCARTLAGGLTLSWSPWGWFPPGSGIEGLALSWKRWWLWGSNGLCTGQRGRVSCLTGMLLPPTPGKCFLYCNGLMDHLYVCQNGNGCTAWYKAPTRFTGTLVGVAGAGRVGRGSTCPSPSSNASPWCSTVFPGCLREDHTLRGHQVSVERLAPHPVSLDPAWGGSLGANACPGMWASAPSLLPAPREGTHTPPPRQGHGCASHRHLFHHLRPAPGLPACSDGEPGAPHPLAGRGPRQA